MVSDKHLTVPGSLKRFSEMDRGMSSKSYPALIFTRPKIRKTVKHLYIR